MEAGSQADALQGVLPLEALLNELQYGHGFHGPFNPQFALLARLMSFYVVVHISPFHGFRSLFKMEAGLDDERKEGEERGARNSKKSPKFFLSFF